MMNESYDIQVMVTGMRLKHGQYLKANIFILFYGFEGSKCSDQESYIILNYRTLSTNSDSGSAV
jgi:hypothetical protein